MFMCASMCECVYVACMWMCLCLGVSDICVLMCASMCECVSVACMCMCLSVSDICVFMCASMCECVYVYRCFVRTLQN